MPDALSKTVPIWCVVLNRYLFPETPQAHNLHTSPRAVSQSEHAQISALIPSFVMAFESLGISASSLRKHITKPLRPLWVTPESQMEVGCTSFAEFHPIVCCTVSKCDTNDEFGMNGYIQGAGDDTENWAHGLTPEVFWANPEKLISTSEDELPQLIRALVKERLGNLSPSDFGLHRLKPTTSLFITRSPIVYPDNLEIDYCAINLLSKKLESYVLESRMDVSIGQDKIGSRNLRKALPSIMEFVTRKLVSEKQSGAMVAQERHLIIACQTGRDLSIGVALAILCLFFDDEGKFLKIPNPRKHLDKSFIRRRYSWIAAAMPDANPSRATLQSVNSFLLGRPIE